METHIRQRQMVMSPLLTSRVIGENEPLTSVFNKVMAAKEVNHKGQGLWVSMRLLPGDMQQVHKDFPHLVDRSMAVARKMGFPEIVLPGDVRNDIYVTLLQGEFDKGKKKTPKNVEVTVGVYDEDGNRIEVAIAIEDVHLCHLRFTFRHRSSQESKDKSEKLFGMAFVKLMKPDGTTLRDGRHDLIVFKGDTRKAEDAKCYLTLPGTKVEHEERERHLGKASPQAHSIPITRDSFQISTLVCSTKLTQNVDLLGLLNWRSGHRDIEQNLRQLMEVDGSEIVKFLQDTLDALFNIMMETSGSEAYDLLVFDALVFIISLIGDIKFQHFNPVLEAYISNHFSATLAYVKLAKVLNHYVSNAESAQKAEVLFAALKALKYLFRFIIQSRKLYLRIYGAGQDDNEFNGSIRTLFLSFNSLMDCPLEGSVKIKGAALKYLPTIVDHVMLVFDPVELSVLVTKFVQSIPDNQLVRQKLNCMCKIVESQLFRQPECRDVLLPLIIDQLSGQLDDNSSRPDHQACATLLSSTLETLAHPHIGPRQQHVQLVMERLLRRVNRTVITMDRQAPLIGPFVACMIAILKQMEDVHYTHYINTFRTRHDIIDFLMETFIMFKDLIGKNVYPTDWVVMNMVQNRVFLRAISQFAAVLTKVFLEPANFELQLWNNFFHLAIAFLVQDSLQLENFSSEKRNKIISKYGDMRKDIGFKIKDMWYSLGPHKMKFIPGMVGPILEMTLVPEPELRTATIPIFFDMMQCEYSVNRCIYAFENELITKLDQEVEGGRGDEQYKLLLERILRALCRQHGYLAVRGEECVVLVSGLLERLLDYRSIITNDSKEQHMSCTVNVLNFYKEKQREDIYIRYLYKLRDLHRDCENFTEAAYTLLLHAELLQWSDRPCAAHLIHRDGCPALSHRELKERLYQEIIQYLDRGKMWESAIRLSKELAAVYENEVFEYEELSRLLRQQACFYENVMQAMRPPPEYFAVGFYGQGFPSFLRNKMFVYRGKEYERYEDFRLRLATQFPNADTMSSTAPPSATLTSSPTQHVQCFTVKPVLNLPLRYKDKPVPEQILSFYRANEVQQFQYSRPFHRGEKDPDNEFVTLWIERVTYTTVYKFPGILQWFEVKTATVEEVSPLENAIETMERTNEKISNMVQRYRWEAALPAHPLSMLLSGIVDAAVMGGSANYEKAFFSTKYMQQHPEDREKIDSLKQLIALQVPLLAEGVQIHGEKAMDDLRPLHDWIVSCFRELKEKVQKLYGVITLPPALTDRKRSRSGSVILPYIMAATLRRLSAVSLIPPSPTPPTTNANANSTRPHSSGSVRGSRGERGPLALCQPEDHVDSGQAERRGGKARRKDQNLSKSQVIIQRGPRGELTLDNAHLTQTLSPPTPQRPKSLQLGDKCLPSLQIIPQLPGCATPPSTRSTSQPLLQTAVETCASPRDTATPPPPPPKTKPCENGSQRDPLQLVPPLPEKNCPRPPHPPPKTRQSYAASPHPRSPAAE